jgi:hypothetical protein
MLTLKTIQITKMDSPVEVPTALMVLVIPMTQMTQTVLMAPMVVPTMILMMNLILVAFS